MTDKGAKPTRAMILAAGLGTRLRPLTELVPKPLLDVGGKPLIDHAIDRLKAFGIAEVVVNSHYLAGQLEDHLARRASPPVRISHEAVLLGTGGGVRQALPLLGPDPFLVLNADTIWLDGPTPALRRLCRRWDDGRMDALLLLVSTTKAIGVEGLGDFYMDPLGRVTRRVHGVVAPYFYGGVQLVHPRLLAGAPDGPFAMNLLWERAIQAERLYGLVHDGVWFHVGTPGSLAEVRENMAIDHIRWIET